MEHFHSAQAPAATRCVNSCAGSKRRGAGNLAELQRQSQPQGGSTGRGERIGHTI